MGGENFEIIAVAEDTEGEAVAGKFYDAAKATYTTLIDTQHTLSSLYGMVNVPTGVLIDEEGTVVRFDEGAYSRMYKAGALEFGSDEYLPIVKDWLINGADSPYVKPAGELSALVAKRTASEAKADAAFRLGSFFELRGDEERAKKYWQQAQQLHPESWNYHRQDWSYDPAEAGAKWIQKFRALDGKPYYEPLALPESSGGQN